MGSEEITDQVIEQWVSFVELAEAMAQVMGVRVSEATRTMLKARQRMTAGDLARWQAALDRAGKLVQ